jgi:hypothetical protein
MVLSLILQMGKEVVSNKSIEKHLITSTISTTFQSYFLKKIKSIRNARFSLIK